MSPLPATLFETYASHCFFGCGHVEQHHDSAGLHDAMQAHYEEAHGVDLCRLGYPTRRPHAPDIEPLRPNGKGGVDGGLCRLCGHVELHVFHYGKRLADKKSTDSPEPAGRGLGASDVKESDGAS